MKLQEENMQEKIDKVILEYSHDELAKFCIDFIKSKIEEIKQIFDGMQTHKSDSRDRFRQATFVWWSMTSDFRKIARDYFPLCEDIFNILDKSIVIESAIIDLRQGTPLRDFDLISLPKDPDALANHLQV